MADDLRRVTAPAGVLVVSGVLDGVHDHVIEALAPMRVVDRLTREGWAAVVLRH
jgi:ribosomal protein L11 methylase PrmA